MKINPTREIIQLCKNALGKLNIAVCKQSSIDDLLTAYERAVKHDIFKELNELARNNQAKLEALSLLVKSESQLYQDIATLIILGFKRDGFFVEFGATDGKILSNTYLLEKNYNWKGILSEPAKTWHNKLAKNRKCIIDLRCISKTTGAKVTMAEAENPEFSSISQDMDTMTLLRSSKRKTSKEYDVETVSLRDLLQEHGAPANIDYLSIDTEGSEYEILRDFDFDNYKFKFITCEHNYGENQIKLRELFEQNGYKQILPEITAWDGWFISKDIM